MLYFSKKRISRGFYSKKKTMLTSAAKGAAAAVSAASRASARQKSTGYNELKGAEPYRAVMKS